MTGTSEFDDVDLKSVNRTVRALFEIDNPVAVGGAADMATGLRKVVAATGNDPPIVDASQSANWA